MKMSPEVIEAIEKVCAEHNQSEEFIQMIKNLVENYLGDNYSVEDLGNIIEKVDLHEN